MEYTSAAVKGVFVIHGKTFIWKIHNDFAWKQQGFYMNCDFTET